MVLREQPHTVTLAFNEPVSGSFGAIRVYNDRGLRVDRGAPRVRGDLVSVALIPALVAGTYVVAWRVAGLDGHVVSDSYVFHYRRATRAGVISAPSDRSSIYRGILRWAALIALAVALGFALFLGGLGAGAACAAAVVLLAGLFVADAVALSGLSPVDALHPSVLAQVVRTATGTVRLVQIGLALVALAAGARLSPIAALAAAGALAAEAFAGHARAGYAPAGTVAVQAVHVVAMGAWLGGLVSLVRSPEILSRFRTVALVAVAALIATGTYNSVVQVHGFERLTATAYGRVLLAKIALLLVVLALAWRNRRRTATHGLVLEVGTIAVIVALAAALSGMVPAREGRGPFSKVFTLGGWRASFVVDPALTGANEVHLFLLSGPGELASDARSAQVVVFPSGRPRARANAGIEEQGAGHYIAETGAFLQAGRWVAEITATREDGARFTYQLTFDIAP